ncbi:hypothetical protein T10_12959 [Trichinella papuae]|uniref:Uncharacterized protein n=1 Tax=Trichinella papuae TaxID=268474 RepID=A0A0V1M203_9BILA|nr:hypothetical protein T10_12959 [Trichinella papuae]
MFAPEAAQAGFTVDFKSLELNTFGGLYTKYLKYNYSECCFALNVLTGKYTLRTYQSTLLSPSSLQVATCAMQLSTII